MPRHAPECQTQTSVRKACQAVRQSFWCDRERACEVGFCYGWCPGFAADRGAGQTAGMTKCRAGKDGFPARSGGARHRVFSLYVVQAGSARGRGRRPGLPRQRSTELVRSSGRPGESCPGFGPRLILNVKAGSLSPSSGREVKGTRSDAGGIDALVRLPPADTRARRRRPRRPSWCRG